MSFIGECTFKGQLIMVSRDEHGKFFISKNGQRVGVRLNASEMCRWFLTSMHEEVSLQTQLIEKTIEVFNREGKISAIKFIRMHTDFGLKEGLDYVNKHCG